MAKSSGKYKFRKHDTIGAADAEHDSRFLESCFVDTGELSSITNLSSPKCIILGRTGAGKSALLLELKRYGESHGYYIVDIKPEDLSFNYISNSTLISGLIEAGINIDPFFKLLWKHVFAVSIFQARFGGADPSTKETWWQKISASSESKQKKTKDEASRKKALEYIQRWGNKFWETTDVRVKEIVEHFEESVNRKAAINVGAEINSSILPLMKGSVKSNANISSNSDKKSGATVTSERDESARRIINEIQTKELTGILELVSEILEDRQKPCFIIIDRLDEAWAEDAIRIRLIKALLGTVSEFQRVKHAKIVPCFRIDLIDKIFREMKSDPGFQEEKYMSLYLPLSWTKDQLEQLLDQRISELIKDQFTNHQPTAKDILPKKMGRHDKDGGVGFILERTWLRPRDTIEFFNICIQNAEGKAEIDKTTLLKSEGEYSQWRFKSIGAEWEHLYPGLLATCRFLLSNTPPSIDISHITDDLLWKWGEKFMSGDSEESGPIYEWCRKFVDHGNGAEARQNLVSLFYHTGIVGLRLGVNQQVQWTNNMFRSVSKSEIGPETRLEIHPALRRVLGTLSS